MTQPVQPPQQVSNAAQQQASRFAGAFGQAFLDQVGANVCNWVTGATGGIIDLSSWATNLHNQANAAMAGVNTIATGITTGAGATPSSDPTQVHPTVSGMQANTAANAAAIAKLTSTGNSSSTGGSSFGDNFGDDPNGNPSASAWTQYQCLSTSKTIGSGLAVSGGQLVTVEGNAGNGSGFSYIVSTESVLTDDQSVIGVLGNANNARYYVSSLMLRAASDMSTAVYVNVASNGIALGYISYDPSTQTGSFNQWTSASIAMSPGATIELRAVGQTYSVYVNSSVVLNHTDASVQSPVGASNRHCGLGIEDSMGFSWQSINFSDLASPPVIGTGWNLFRSATSAVAMQGSSWSGVGAGTFDTEGPCANVTITSLGYGVITIQKTGWYVMRTNASMSQPCGTSYVFNAGIYYRPVSTGVLGFAGIGQDSSGSNVYNVGMCTIAYLYEGDQVSPAFYQAGSNSVVGNAAGTDTYFTGALVTSLS
ncbi:hypothetical protein G4X40_19700 [Rhodococcus sp. D2-41]|uniref:DUF7257 domain-containing protein n=1 Tax=Speluncibacter jeojiensis TaxID=2710754 RepID=UPI00240FAFCF|nr:hypothetical protein [Rhodococcus sp. D2-41]MDG3012368.1 hypothetical protein [Rhodococcus sp. D2-41]